MKAFTVRDVFLKSPDSLKHPVLQGFNYLLTYLLTYLITYLLTYLLHGAESFERG